MTKGELGMTANVENMAYVRDVPWHGIGMKVEGLMTSEQALAAVPELASDVVREPLFLSDGIEVPGMFANVRSADRRIVGTVGAAFRIVQNRDAFAWGDALVDSGEGKWETVGSLMGGSRVFASMELPEGVRVPGDEGEIKPWLLISNGFDGRTMLRGDVVLIRTVCTNTWTLATKGATRSFKIRHTGSIEGKLAMAREALGISFTYLANFEKQAERLVGLKLVDRQIEDILRAAFPVPEAQDTPERIDQSDFAKVLNVYRTAPNLDPIRGTGWGVLQAGGEYLDHETEYHGRRFDAASVKADSILYGGVAAAKKQDLFDRLLAKAK
jgi:phage/plasmid-like protein (TIGR03299 family)